jgi:precorrin-6Y C5,15-methyltransferase (decarboxylating)
VLWDIGAGSGSVSLEAARLCPTLDVFAIERAEPAYRQIRANLDTFPSVNVHPILGEAPEALTSLPTPHAVFIGGSGGRFTEIISTVVQRLQPGGRIVINCITLEHFTAGWQLLSAQQALRVQATSVQLAHAVPLGTLHRFESDSPLFILQAHKA